jgi:hypothetical protein
MKNINEQVNRMRSLIGAKHGVILPLVESEEDVKKVEPKKVEPKKEEPKKEEPKKEEPKKEEPKKETYEMKSICYVLEKEGYECDSDSEKELDEIFDDMNLTDNEISKIKNKFLDIVLGPED